MFDATDLIESKSVTYDDQDNNEWDSLIDEWGALIEEFDAIDTKIDHIRILDEIQNSTVINLEKKPKEVDMIDYKLCPDCNVRCKILENSIVCEKCGMSREWQCYSEGYSNTIEQNYNTSKNAYVSFNIIGSGSYCYHRSFLKTCSDYSAFRTNKNKKEITNIIFQYEGSKPPNNVITLSAELFDTIINAGHVYRKNGKKGVMAACLYYACMMNNLARTPKDISAIMGTEERYLSQGDKILQELNELDIINIPTYYEPLDDYLNQFFPTLGIPDKYKTFIVDILHRAEKKNLHVKNECRTTTKCVGAIYLLTRRVKSLNHIKKDVIAHECNNMSKSTFLKYYNLLCLNHAVLKKSFKRHNISMPLDWKH